ncbi:MAG: hypothetical protein LBP75_04825 [Planctomycetota bacterium]|jgi:hypothetical protein|nr:hypothetical protein [Planctomycetota bacterium]
MMPSANDLEEKRSALAGLEGARREPKAPRRTKDGLGREVERLNRELRVALATNAILEESQRKLEAKTVLALREAKEAQRELRRRLLNRSPQDETVRYKMLVELQARKDENALLTQALVDSENEIARLVGDVRTMMERFL